MVCFQKILIRDKFGKVLQRKMPVYFMAIWLILRPFGIFYGTLVFIFWSFGTFFPFLEYWTTKTLAILLQISGPWRKKSCRNSSSSSLTVSLDKRIIDWCLNSKLWDIQQSTHHVSSLCHLKKANTLNPGGIWFPNP
jgi:hypothetical protein